MNPWDTYFARINTMDSSNRDEIFLREKSRLRNRYRENLSLKTVKINGTDRSLSILSSDSFDNKLVHTLPGESLSQGDMLLWDNEYWIVTQVDPEKDLYYRGTIRRCNYLLKWISDSGNIIEQWCVVDQNGESFSSGEKRGSGFDITVGDAKTLLIISCNEHTIKFDRKTRFLIDSYESGDVLAYRVVSPFRLFGGSNRSGVICLSISECNVEQTDNVELHIADYYKFFEKNSTLNKTDTDGDSTKKAWF